MTVANGKKSQGKAKATAALDRRIEAAVATMTVVEILFWLDTCDAGFEYASFGTNIDAAWEHAIKDPRARDWLNELVEEDRALAHRARAADSLGKLLPSFNLPEKTRTAMTNFLVSFGEGVRHVNEAPFTPCRNLLRELVDVIEAAEDGDEDEKPGRFKDPAVKKTMIDKIRQEVIKSIREKYRGGDETACRRFKAPRSKKE